MHLERALVGCLQAPRCNLADVVTVDWQAAYGAALELLRTLEPARPPEAPGFGTSPTATPGMPRR
jgi:hypothetical protein